jgi:hypothetical protein
VVAGPEHLVEVTVEDIDVDCQDGLLMVGLHSLCPKSSIEGAYRIGHLSYFPFEQQLHGSYETAVYSSSFLKHTQ